MLRLTVASVAGATIVGTGMAVASFRGSLPEPDTAVALPDADDLPPAERIPAGLRVPFEDRFPPDVDCPLTAADGPSTVDGDCVAWSHSFSERQPSMLDASVVVPSRGLVVIVERDRVAALDLADGRTRWSLSDEAWVPAIDPSRWRHLLVFPTHDLLLVLDEGGDRSSTTALRLSSGQPRWRTDTAGWFGASWIAGGQLRLLAFDSTDHLSLGSLDVSTGALVVHDRTVLAATGDPNGEAVLAGGRLSTTNTDGTGWSVEAEGTAGEDWAWLSLTPEVILLETTRDQRWFDRSTGVELARGTNPWSSRDPEADLISGLALPSGESLVVRRDEGDAQQAVVTVRRFDDVVLERRIPTPAAGGDSIQLTPRYLILPDSDTQGLEVVDLESGASRTIADLAPDFIRPVNDTTVIATSPRDSAAIDLDRAEVIWRADAELWPIEGAPDVLTWRGGVLRVDPDLGADGGRR